jgi:hypothetical protein
MAKRVRWNMIGGVGSVRGLAVMIATEGIFVCASIANNAPARCQQYRRAASRTYKVPKKTKFN